MALTAVIINDADFVLDGLETMLLPYADRVEIVGTLVGPAERLPATFAIIDMFKYSEDVVSWLRGAADLDCFERIVVYAWTMSPDEIRQALDNGASGILAKSAEAPRIIEDLEHIAAGERVVHDFSPGDNSDEWQRAPLPTLTERERELLSLVAHGTPNREIATKMFLAESTVKTYLKRLYRKLGINSRAQCVMRAVELGATALPNQPDETTASPR